MRIEKNKRNGRKQKDHIELMNTMKELKKRLGEPVNDGRPVGSGTAQERVNKWREQHPDGTKSQCKAETGLSYPTIRKWWEYQPKVRFEDGHITVKVTPSQGLSDLLVEEFKDRL